MGRGDIRQQTATAPAGIEKTIPPEAGENRCVKTPALALTQHRTIPVEAKPAQIIKNALLCSGAVTGGIEIVEPKEPFTTLQAGDQP